jgi:hypothetical protein
MVTGSARLLFQIVRENPDWNRNGSPLSDVPFQVSFDGVTAVDDNRDTKLTQW